MILQHRRIERCGFRLTLKYSACFRTSCAKRSVFPQSPLPITATSIGRSREDSTTRASPSTFSRLMASRITANASWPMVSRGTDNSYGADSGSRRDFRRSLIGRLVIDVRLMKGALVIVTRCALSPRQTRSRTEAREGGAMAVRLSSRRPNSTEFTTERNLRIPRAAIA